MGISKSQVANTMQNMINKSRSSLSKHRKQVDSTVALANLSYNTRRNVRGSVQKASDNYQRIVASQSQIRISEDRMRKMSSTLDAHRINTMSTKRMMLGLIQQFNNETGKTGKNIDDLQAQIAKYVNDNSEEVLQMVQAERVFYHDGLYSTKVRKGIVTGFNKLKIPINRKSTIIVTLISSTLGYFLGKKI